MIYMCILRIQTTCGNLWKDLRYIYTCGHAGIVLKRKKLQLILLILFKID